MVGMPNSVLLQGDGAWSCLYLMCHAVLTPTVGLNLSEDGGGQVEKRWRKEWEER